MTIEIEKMKAEHEVKVGRKTVPMLVARLKKQVLVEVEDGHVVLEKGVVGCLFNEYGELSIVIQHEAPGLQKGAHVPVYPDEIELM